jgi:hypothetical protein
MLFRMLDGNRPYLGFFLSCIGNPAGQEQSHSDNQQNKPDSESVHLRLPLPSIKRPRRRAAAKQIVHRCLAEHGDLAGGISILLGKFRAASNREIAELLQVKVQC